MVNSPGRTLDLFPDTKSSERYVPLAERLRPQSWEDFRGLKALDQNLVEQLRAGRGVPPSLILWGPPGSGKTTLAKLIGQTFDCEFVPFSAVLGGVKEVREIVASAKLAKRPTILFVDEIHRFSRSQQDAFLPHLESGAIILIGATTENPSFYLTGALLSRSKTVCFSSLPDDELEKILERALAEFELPIKSDARSYLCSLCAGDARRLLNYVEALKDAFSRGALKELDQAALKQYFARSGVRFYDRSGEEHYNMISAFIKSLRGSSADAALYWGFRMMESGEDPRFIIRRMLIFASEDIGNADPRALQIAVATAAAFEQLGLPEGRIPIAQCITFLATAPKSNRSYAAMNKVLEVIREQPKVEVPLHLRNAPTKLMKDLDYGKGYQYPHDAVEGFVPGVSYLPAELEGESFYKPSEHGYEKLIGERLQRLSEVRKVK